MKLLTTIKISLLALTASSLYISCAKTAADKLATEDLNFSNKAIVQVFQATVNANRNFIYLDGGPVTGATIATGGIFPASGNGFSLDGGLRDFLVKDTLSTSTQLPLAFGQNMNASKHYTIFLYDTINSPKQKTVLDNIVVPSDTTARIRVANFIYNPTSVPAVDVYSYYLGANIFTNVAVTDVTNFISYPSRIPLDTLYVRETGTLNQLLKVSIGTLTPKRSYTFVYRGSHRAATKSSSLFATY